jgi:hypothetical protein
MDADRMVGAMIDEVGPQQKISQARAGPMYECVNILADTERSLNEAFFPVL